MKSLKEMLLCAPDSQLDSCVFPLIEKWTDPPTALQVLEVVDQCIHGGLSSGIVLSMMQMELEERLDAEGKTLHDLVPLATWRNREIL